MQYETLVYTDELTGLKNRRFLNKLKEHVIPRIKKSPGYFTVVMTDIDHFKDVNDTYGHLKGDQVITGFGQYLQSSLRREDFIIRYGGDEFIVIQPGLNRKNAYIIWERVINRLSKMRIADIKIGISAGIASFPEDGENLIELIKEADTELYAAKRAGRNRIGKKVEKRLRLGECGFINRKEETYKLLSYVNSNAAIVVRGNAGIGKTRLIKEALSRTREREIMWSDCLPFNMSIPYYPLRELIKYKIKRAGTHFLEKIPEAFRLELEKIVPDAGMGTDINKSDNMLDRYRLYEGIKRVLAEGKNSKILVIDNTQWIDSNSLQVLEYIMRTSGNIVYIFAYRKEEIEKQVENFLGQVSRYIRVKELTLAPLKPTHVKEMVETSIGGKNSHLSEFIAKKSGGTPFYVEELIRELYEQGFLRVENGDWRFEEPAKYITPRGIEDVIERKFKQLPREEQNLMKFASVAGEVNITLLENLMQYNEGHIIGLIESCIKSGLLKGQENNIKFADEITREVIQNRHVGNIRARSIHKKVGEWLEFTYKDNLTQIAERLFYHFNESGVWYNCAKYATMAGDNAKEIYANNAAIDYYTDAIKCLNMCDNPDVKKDILRCLMNRASVLKLTGKYDKALQDIEAALEIARETGDKIQEAKCFSSLSDVHVASCDFRKELKEAKTAYGIYRKTGNIQGMVSALNLIGVAYYNMGEFKNAIKYFEQSLELNKKINSLIDKSGSFNNLATIYSEYQDFDKALAYFKKALRIRRKMHHKEGVGGTLNNIGILFGNLGKQKKALKYYRDSLKVVREIGNIEGEVTTLLNIGVAYEELNKYKKAFEYYNTALKLARDINLKHIEYIIIIDIGILYKILGNYDKSLEYCRNSLKTATKIQDKKGQITTQYCIADVFLELGEYQQALKHFSYTYETSKKMGERDVIIISLLAIGRAYTEMGNYENAHLYYDKAEHAATNFHIYDIPILIGRANLNLAEGNLQKAGFLVKKIQKMLEEDHPPSLIANSYFTIAKYNLKKGKYKNAEENFNMARKIYRKLGLKKNLGEVYYYLALMFKQTGNKTENVKNFEKAIAIFKELKTTKWLDKVQTNAVY